MEHHLDKLLNGCLAEHRIEVTWINTWYNLGTLVGILVCIDTIQPYPTHQVLPSIHPGRCLSLVSLSL